MPRHLVLGALVAALVLASGSQASNTRATVALDAANTLMAQPWTGSHGLAAQYRQQTLASIAQVNGKRITHLHGSGWHFDVNLKNVSGSMNIASAPGFTSASPTGFAIAAPLNGGWSMGISGAAHADGSACCTPAGKNLFTVKGDLPFAFGLSNLRLTAAARLNASDPTRPTLTSAQVSATANVGGSSWFPATPVALHATLAGGAILLGGDVASTSFSWGTVAARLTIHVQLRILPRQVQVEAQVGKTVDLSVALQDAVLSLGGTLSVRLPDPIGRKSGSLGVDVPFQLPSSRSFNDALVALQPPLPRLWPPQGAPDRADAHARPTTATAADFGRARDALESGIAAHLPYGTVLSIDSAALRLKKSYGLENDSMIWSGHYLAAEAFRYAATASPDALARVHKVLDGLKTNFGVTTDAVVMDGKISAVGKLYAGVFARTSMPDNDPSGYTDGALNKRAGACYYVSSPDGWKVGKVRYASLAEAKAHIAHGLPLTPAGTATYGWGCGDRGEKDHPISRDQYLGLFMGLGYAYALVPDPGVREQIRKLVDPALGFLLRNNWNAPLPPTGQISTTFIGDFDAQLSLLRVGATVDPAAFDARYRAVAAAVDLAWIPVWISTIDPAIAYYKFNLGHASLGTAAYLENDPALKPGYLRAYRILAAPTLTHRNAYFNLVDILAGATTASSPAVSNPSMTRGAEIASDLADWLTRWDAVKGPNGMPRNVTSTTSASYLASLWTPSPQGVVAYTDTNSNREWLANFVVPLWARPGNGMDFVWQRSPFGSGIDGPSSTRSAKDPVTGASYTCSATPPSARQLALCSGEASREGPGIDFLLPYWIGAFLKLLP